MDIDKLVDAPLVLASQEPCRVCGRGQEERPICFKGRAYCCENCRKELVVQVLAENQGDLKSLEAERGWHDFTPEGDKWRFAKCQVCGLAPSPDIHPEWSWDPGSVSWVKAKPVPYTKREGEK